MSGPDSARWRSGLDGFHLNGKPLKLFGLNRHQLFPYLGMAANARLQRRDAELLKNTLNCNMVRCSHYPQSPHFLDACDELGLMVWEEPPGWQYVGSDKAFRDLVVQNVHDMVMRDRNRPSVIVWATRLNETGNPTALYKQTRQTAGQLDTSRQTSGAMRIYSTKDWAQDVFAYDDYSLHNEQERSGAQAAATRVFRISSARPSEPWTDRRCIAGSTTTPRSRPRPSSTPESTTSPDRPRRTRGCSGGPELTTRR